ncbi:heavy metal translocating P-type ATPase [Candidimonas humi]|uniref:Heavy metal translocating P-type ATPase n=1 Tax=Candidimonas humi TaxID=683355 RepID=A0ABV8P3S3_9BURK|nr:heavy metal translocating P-type ATPase [Candidimonas humi]MBV6306922.1 heavy metal translocating P-type ATPase [Candidimonas humi]
MTQTPNIAAGHLDGPDSAAPGTAASIPVLGMSCASCVGRVERALAAVPGVARASVNLARERADVSLSDAAQLPSAIAAVEAAGYEVPRQSMELAVADMSCASCVGRVERALSGVPGVTGAAVNLATGRAQLQVLPGTQADALLRAVARAGYEARVLGDAPGQQDDTQARRAREQAGLRRALILAIVLALPVFLVEMGGHLFLAWHHFIEATIGRQASWVAQFVLTGLVLFGPGWRFFRHGIPALLRGAPDMNSLVASGTLAAFLYSSVATFAPGLLPAGTVHVYYESAAVIVALILLGRYFEARAKGRASAAIERLLDLQPRTARVLRDGEAHDVPIAEVRSGDLVQVRPGERIAVDGEVVEGASFVDESMISGEPMPVEKGPGATLVGGTMNQNGALVFRATQVGGSTMLAQIIRMVEQAQGSKLPIQALVDRITMWFVPAVMAAALLTCVAWLAFGPTPSLGLALVNAVAVLIVACPCAMGLATPTSIMVGTGRAAQLGVLFRKGEALQLLEKTSVLAVDKTGTLTKGRPELTDLLPASGFDRQRVLARVAAVEAKSEHPIARAIVAAARAEGIAVPEARDFAAAAGMGAGAQVDGERVDVGADRYMAQLGLDVSVFAEAARGLGEQGRTPLYAAIGGRLAAMLAVADPLRDTTAQAIRTLHGLGLKIAMVTGDNRRTAQVIASQLGIDEVVAEVLPAGKVDAVLRLKAGHGALAYVGDGINDAPALAAADVGLAVGGGTDIAIEAADVVLMSGDLDGVAAAIALSRATMRNIRQNLFWAFAYNVALIPVAAGVLYLFGGPLLSPVFAAAAMALSSVFVLGNALRLRRFSFR